MAPARGWLRQGYLLPTGALHRLRSGMALLGQLLGSPSEVSGKRQPACMKTQSGLSSFLSKRRVKSMTYLLEQWKPVVGYEDIYEISCVGNVRRVKKRRRYPANGILAYSVNPDGYRMLVLVRMASDKRFPFTNWLQRHS